MLNFFCFLAQPRVLHLAKSALYHAANVAKGSFICRRVVFKVDSMYSLLFFQQFCDFFFVFIRPVLMLALGGAKILVSCCINTVSWKEAQLSSTLSVICMCSARSSSVLVNYVLTEGFFSFETCSRFCATFPWGRRLGKS